MFPPFSEKELLGMFKIQCIDQDRRAKEKTLLVVGSSFWEINLVITDFVETFLEGFLWYFGHSSNFICDFETIFVDGVDIARNHTEPVRATAGSTLAAIDTSSEAAGRWANNVDSLFLRVRHLEGRNKPPAIFLDVSNVLVSAKDVCLLIAARFSGNHTAPGGTIDFEKLRIGFRVGNNHVERMARSKAAPAREGKIFFGGGNYILSDEIFEVRSGNAAKEFLPPSPAIMTNFHRLARTQRRIHCCVSQTSVHCFRFRLS